MTSSDRIRVAFVITELEVGGAERCLANLAMGLDPTRFEPVVYSIGSRPHPDRAALVQQVETANVPIEFIEADRSWQVMKALRRLRRAFKQQRPHVVQTFMFHANVLGTLAARVTDAQVVLGMRVADPSRWRMRLERVAARRAARVICVSQSVADFMRDRGRVAPSKLAVIPNGIDVTAYSSGQAVNKESIGLARHAKMLLTVGRLHEQKGLDWLLNLLPQVLAEAGDCELVIAGDGPDRAKLERQAASLGIAERVHFVGWRDDIPQLFRAADALVLPSRWEGMPNVVLEAMAAGLPIVATSVEGVDQLLGEGATQQAVPVGDEATFQQALRAVLSDDCLATRLGAGNRQRAKGEFSLSEMVRRYEAVYSEIVAK